jgi:RimJ/RimL family protein N-acetyltransferase
MGIEIVNSVEKKEIYPCLLNSKYGKFNLWPNASDVNVCDFLFERIDRLQNEGKIFVARASGEAAAILTVRDLEWDTRHFGVKSARIDYVLTNQTLPEAVIAESLNGILAEFHNYRDAANIKFVFADVDARDRNVNFVLQEAGYKYILTWTDAIFNPSTKLPALNGDAEIDTNVTPEDVEYFRKISSSYFKGGRFYMDANFDRELVDKMYMNLIDSSLDNDDMVFVYRLNGEPIGFFIYSKIVDYANFSNLRVASTRYLVVDSAHRKKQAGYNLFAATLKDVGENSDLIITGLEVHNLASLNLHAKLGFKFNHSHNAYHWWG